MDLTEYTSRPKAKMPARALRHTVAPGAFGLRGGKKKKNARKGIKTIEDLIEKREALAKPKSKNARKGIKTETT